MDQNSKGCWTVAADLIYLSYRRGIVGWWRAGKPVFDCLRLGDVVLSCHIWWQWVGASHPCNTISFPSQNLSHNFNQFHSLTINLYLFDPFKNTLHSVCSTHETDFNLTMKIDGPQKRTLENMSATHKIIVPCQCILKCLKKVKSSLYTITCLSCVRPFKRLK